MLWFRGGAFDPAREAAFAAALGDLAAHAGPVGGLVATGGDTARAALLARGARGLHLSGEVEPGVPIGIADASPPLPAATKAGAFGTPPTLDRARRALHGLSAAGRDAGRAGADLGSA